ncbi:fatty acid oxidation complex subunit alpha FadB [Rugamonas sp. FT82W]|uniref:enoyl-CoA hydratase n=1 Tax=Duganella vulcania TaxID=2692166 RepID=A0A845FXF9_9BURK|nr:fatty acid oxidation complex subunit alpha FadB [Duganella vulcania]
MYQGKSIRMIPLADGFAELSFDRQGDAINKLDSLTMTEFGEAIRLIAGAKDLRGLLITSAKDAFIVGADITEFSALFQRDAAAIAAVVSARTRMLSTLEDLHIPTVVVINGAALGGGLEIALCGSLRIMSSQAQIGLPEVKLGLFPGYGGTVRLPRITGPATALEWITTGKTVSATAALDAGAVDEVAEPADLRARALALLAVAAKGEIDWAVRQHVKRGPVTISANELDALIEQHQAKARALRAKHQPAAAMALDLMRAAIHEPRDSALQLESEAFGNVAKTQAASSLVQIFLNEQTVKKIGKTRTKGSRPLQGGAVLGAGIMGGGIAYTSALSGVPVLMKDIAQSQLDLGMGEARKQLAKQVKSGRKTEAAAATVLNGIHPTLEYNGFHNVDIVIEAVVENLQVKHKVLCELEQASSPGTIIASNTSSLRIDHIAAALQRPGEFVGMHFFNPVPVMPLVEVIQGSYTTPEAVATAVNYCIKMGKTPIVVKDCPGFLVNRVLTAYIRGFLQLVIDGADFRQVDRVMEAFGWPMGPAYLEDVVGLDTGSHVCDVISAGYSERMPPIANDALRLLAINKRHGQKNGVGFYRYESDPNGKPRRSDCEDTHTLLAALQPNGKREFTDDEIVDRMMVPLVLEAIRALEEGVVGCPAELDMALILGIGFPAYLGGALKYADWLGAQELVSRADALTGLGPLYEPTDTLRKMSLSGQSFYKP